MATADDDGLGAPPPSELSGMDKFFSNTALAVVTIIFSFCCCPLVGLIVGGIGMATCKDPKSKQMATICLIVSVVAIVINLGLQFSGHGVQTFMQQK
jgi:hypothetical protein